MKKLQDTRYQLWKLGADPETPKMIQKVICAMGKHAELDKVVRNWHKQDADHKKVWKNCKKHFASGICDVLTNPANNKQNEYANKVVEKKLEEMNNNTKFIAQQLLESKQVAIELYEEINKIKKIPKTSNTTQQNNSDKQTRLLTNQEKNMKFIGSMSFAKAGGAPRPQKILIDMANGEQSKQRHPDSNIYCWTCGYDLSKKHLDNGGQIFKKPGNKAEATIENHMGGTTHNCFHHPN